MPYMQRQNYIRLDLHLSQIPYTLAPMKSILAQNIAMRPTALDRKGLKGWGSQEVSRDFVASGRCDHETSRECTQQGNSVLSTCVSLSITLTRLRAAFAPIADYMRQPLAPRTQTLPLTVR